MTTGIGMEELLAWSDEAAGSWRAHLEANPALLELPCDIGGAANVQGLVRHIWAVELRWSQRVAGLPQTPREGLPAGPLDALYQMHTQGLRIARGLLDAGMDWEETISLDYDWMPPHARHSSKRKVLAHMLFHSQRHWAQLATLVRKAGYPADFKGDLLFSSAVR